VDFQQSFLFELRSVCNELWSHHGQSLAGLVTTGETHGGLSWKLFHEYKEWGLLHLLVLSGSQYYAFSNAWKNITLAIQKILFKVSSPFWSSLTLFPAASIYLNSLKMPAPLLRCALLSFAYGIFSPLKWSALSITCLVFLFHIGWIENSVPSDSAFLSWLAFFILQFVNVITKNKILRALIITSLLHIFISVFKEAPLSPMSWIIACLSNIICLPLFERVIFPCVGYVSAACLLLCPLFTYGLKPYYFKEFIAPAFSLILDLAILPVLVANSAFRYTFQQ
jgi:hypothetical protein